MLAVAFWTGETPPLPSQFGPAQERGSAHEKERQRWAPLPRHGRIRQRQGVHSVPGRRTAFPRVVPQLPRSEHHGGSPPASRPGPAPPSSSCAAAQFMRRRQVPRRRPVHAPLPRSCAAAQVPRRRQVPCSLQLPSTAVDQSAPDSLVSRASGPPCRPPSSEFQSLAGVG
jgi:hypothetical protein